MSIATRNDIIPLQAMAVMELDRDIKTANYATSIVDSIKKKPRLFGI